MVTVNIVVEDGERSTHPVRWLDATPWVGTRFQTHVSVVGGENIGVDFDRGCDNAVCTLTGIVPWSVSGETMFESLGGSRVRVNNGVSDRYAVLGTPMVLDSTSRAVIRFSVQATQSRSE